MKNKLGQESMFPFIEEIQGEYEKYWQTTLGASKRFYAACAAMQGLLANTNSQWSEGDSYTKELKPSLVCKAAFIFADELLTQENK